MEVILIERVERLGRIGDTVKVANGYARNYLLPKKKALSLTAENRAYFEKVRDDLEKKEIIKHKDLELKIEKIKQAPIQFSMKASDDGKLYGSITARDIDLLLHDTGLSVGHSHIIVPGHRIRKVGEHVITFVFGEQKIEHGLLVIAE